MTFRAVLAAALQRLAHRIAGRHVYLSTGCLHEDEVMPDGRTGHEYCAGTAGLAGAKRPARCKHCDAPCICPRHQSQESK